MDRKWWTLCAVCLGIFMLLLDISVVNVALPSIQRSLHSTFADLQWVVDAYTLTLASFLLTAGVIGDMFGRRRLFALGLLIFSMSSLVCGLSTTPLMLNLARGVQGVGGAIMFATCLALIAQAFTGRERGTAFGVYGGVIGGAVAIGPLVGGVLTSGIGWRWIFFVNLPIGAVAIAITLAKVADSRDPTRRRVDWIGFITFSASLFMLVFALVQGNAWGWHSPTIVSLLVGAVVTMAAFLVAEWLGPSPMLDLALFRRPAMVGVSLTAFVLSSTIFAMLLYVTFYLQDVLGYGPLAAGIRFLPISVLSFLISPIAGKLTLRVHSRYLLGLGLLLIALGCKLASHIQPDSTWTVLLPGFLVAGIGIGVTNPVVASVTVSVVPPERSGMASGASNTFRQVGIATGIAALGAVFLSQIRPHAITALAATQAGREVIARDGPRLLAQVANGGVRQAAAGLPSPAARQALLAAYQAAFSSTLDHLMSIAMIVSLIGAVGALVLVRQRDFLPSVPTTGPTAATTTAAANTTDATGPTAQPGARSRARTRSTPFRHAKQRPPKHRHAKRRHPAAASVTAVARPSSPTNPDPERTGPLGNDPTANPP
jgi:EmrB/QacA subfamily drug resistance transporter